jgi:HlyD family secretion protein
VLEATLRSAEAQASEARRVLARVQDLFKRGIATQAQLDEARRRSRSSMRPSARPRPTSPSPRCRRVRRRSRRRRTRCSRRPPRSTRHAGGCPSAASPRPPPAASTTSSATRRHRRPVGAGRVAAARRRGEAAHLRAGGAILGNLRRFGCSRALRRLRAGPDRAGQLRFPSPEFTPPVIYSLETRQKLVYLVEARPEGGSDGLQPGQIVDVELGR